MSRTYEQLQNQIVHNKITDLKSEVERLRGAIKRWSLPTGFHRVCGCRFCQKLWEIADEENE